MSIDERTGEITQAEGAKCDGCSKTFTDGGYRLDRSEHGLYRRRFACDDSCLAKVKARFVEENLVEAPL
jgi:hypothetical protein